MTDLARCRRLLWRSFVAAFFAVACLLMATDTPDEPVPAEPTVTDLTVAPAVVYEEEP